MPKGVKSKPEKQIEPRQAIFERLGQKFHDVNIVLATILMSIAEEIAEVRMNCAKAMCQLCDAGDPRVTVNGREMHVCSFLNYEENTNTKHGSIQLPCKANPIWSMA